jgi:hypothetical protein
VRDAKPIAIVRASDACHASLRVDHHPALAVYGTKVGPNLMSGANSYLAREGFHVQ